MDKPLETLPKLRKSQRNSARKKIREDIRALERIFGIDIDYSQGGAAARARYRLSKHTGTFKAVSGDYTTALLSPITWEKILAHKMAKAKIPAPIVAKNMKDGSKVEAEIKKIRAAISAIVTLREREAVGIVVDSKEIIQSIAKSQGFGVKKGSA